MVFTSAALLVRSRGPDEFWRKRRVFKLAAVTLHGRPRNVFTFAIRAVHRALAYATKGRKLKKLDMVELWQTRISASSEQYGVSLDTFRNGLNKSDILLNR
uniref:39S ribosomal protein L20, mitochondrial n=1 Tax=Megaselia scalaris TaxID=36166 RepID=T1H147_MEGSC